MKMKWHNEFFESPFNCFMRAVIGSWLRWVIVALACMALVATPFQTMRLLDFTSDPFRILISVGVVVFAAFIGFKYSQALLAVTTTCSEILNRIKLWQILLLGLLIRIIWMFFFPAQPGSDGRIYLDLAKQLSNGENYEAGDSRAYWPVGYPAFLAVWIKVFGNARLAYLISNFALFICGVTGVAYLARKLADERASRLAALLFAFWPNLIFGSGTPEKEMVVLAFLPWVYAWMLLVLDERGGGFYPVLGIGLSLGFLTLVQPSLQFLPLIVALLFFIGCHSWKNRFGNSLLVLFVASTVVAPWTIRNYLLFDVPVLVATNGGGNLYRANNPLATGGWTPRGEVDLDQLSEIEHDREGRRLAFLWIRENPKKFLQLIVEKQIRFMGDDAVGVYNTFKVGHAPGGNTLYVILKSAANAWWMIIWFLIAFLTIRLNKSFYSRNSFAFASIWFWMYLFGIHSVFESAGKYHVPLLWVPCVIISVLLSSAINGRNTK